MFGRNLSTAELMITLPPFFTSRGASAKRRHEAKAGRLTASAGERATATAELRLHGAFSDPEQRRSRGHMAEAEAAQLHGQSSEEGP